MSLLAHDVSQCHSAPVSLVPTESARHIRVWWHTSYWHHSHLLWQHHPSTHPRMDGPVACLSHHPCLWQPHAASLEIQHASEIIVFINRNYFIFINSFLNLVWIKVLLMQFLEAWRSTVPMDQNISTSPQLQSRNHNITVMSQDITAILQHITSNQRLKQLYWNKSYNTFHYIKD